MSYSYKDVGGRQRVIPITYAFLYPREKHLQFHIWVVDPYSYMEDNLISDLPILEFMISDNLISKVCYVYGNDSLVPLYRECMVNAEIVQVRY